MADIRKQIGLDFLRPRGVSPEPPQERLGIGELKDDETFAVVFEILGPANQEKAGEFNTELQTLLDRFKTKIRYQKGAAEGLSAALIAYGKELLRAVLKAEPQPARLHEVVEQTNIPIDVALTVVRSLEGQGYLTVVDRDLKGNHALKLSAAGVALLR